MDSLQARLRSQMELAPERRALCFYTADRRPSWKSYREVYAEASAYADRLGQAGLSPGDRCLLILPSDEYCATALLGTLLQGGVPLLVAPPIVQSGSHSSLLENIDRVVEATRPKVVLCAPMLTTMGQDLQARHPSTRVLFDFKEQVPRSNATLPSPAATDIAALQLTSGTTGAPRICVWSQERVLAALDGMTAAMQLEENDVCFNWTPLYHDMGLTNNFLLCLTSGVPLAMLSPQAFVKRPALWLQGLQATGATITWSPNFGFALAARRVRATDLEGLRLDGVRAFWNAAEKIHLETVLDFHRKFQPYGVRWRSLKTNFGCAENIGGATFSDPQGEIVVERVDRGRLHEDGVAEPVDPDGGESVSIVSAGRPYPGLSISILSSTGESLPDGEVGEIALQTPSAMNGYLHEPEESTRTLNASQILTGDLGYRRGDQLFWTGRVRERINARGKKLDPSDFESALGAIDRLRPGCFAAFGIDDRASGTQKIVIVTELLPAGSLHLSKIVEAVQRAAFEKIGVAVADVVLVPKGSMTKTSSGKRRHRHYRRLYCAGELESIRVNKACASH